MNPIDLLPVKTPLTDPSPPTEVDFYNNVVRHLIKDVIKMELNGIPISLHKVKELEDTVTKVLLDAAEKLKNNLLIQEFLNKTIREKQGIEKPKTYQDFLKSYNHKNKIHFSYVINHYLRGSNKGKGYTQEEWTKRDLKKLCQVYETTFLRNMLNSELTADNVTYIVLPAMQKLAQEKADIYNTNRKEKLNREVQKELSKGFNPSSSVQKEAFFKSLGIESESLTNKGQDQWNRKELEKLNSQLSLLIKSKNYVLDEVS